jgi:hypothetical protein
MLRSALEHYQSQQRLTAAGLLEARRAAKRGPMQVARVVAAYQVAVARDAVQAVPLMLAEQGIPDEPVGDVSLSSLAGRASDGRPLDTLFAQATSESQSALMVATQLQDAARIAAGVGITARPNVHGYARMLVPPSCSRCAVLAGKFFKWNTGFQRHPRCDCRHIPSTEALGGDLTSNPRAYFNSLTADDQAATFGKANAAAIREGSDVGQVVNAYRDTYTTVTATAAAPVSLLQGIRFNTRAPDAVGRLTPEAVYLVAGDDRVEAIRLLRLHGYLL